VNSVCHLWGTRRFATADNSRNNAVAALFTLGGGWHNNHHAFHWSAKEGLKPWEVDISYAVLKALEKVGVVWGLKVPTDAQVDRLEKKTRDRLAKDPDFRLRNTIDPIQR
jgi:stearoyl-CoA desaturase (delta-9 desaturase)